MPSYQQLSPSDVKIQGGFWGARQEINRQVTIPSIYQQLKATGRIDALRLEWQPGRQPVPHRFWDSDIAKWIEASSFSLQSNPDPDLEALLEEVIGLIADAQQPDGYLNSYYTNVEPELRWKNLRDNHELYCAGHLIEAATAHYQATGRTSLLNPVLRYANHIDALFGPGSTQLHGYCGHQEIELALIKLYQQTNDQRWLNLSRYFIAERGRQPHYFDLEALERGEDPARFRFGDYRYNQSHLPVKEQNTVVGHAVRAMYMYSAMTDLVAETGDNQLWETLLQLLKNLSTKHLYLTGGIGPSGDNEGFTSDYDLPNETAYAETCASIGLVFWMQRMLLVEPNAHFADLLELALYNGVLSGVSLDGRSFFYENPLASQGSHHRQAWFSCACCPPNLARLLASLGSYIYTKSSDTIFIHQYIQNDAHFNLPAGSLAISMQTDYPWNGKVKISIELEQPQFFTIGLRIPGWCRKHQLVGPFKQSDVKFNLGYAQISREWLPGDEMCLDLTMPVERIFAHPSIRADNGRAALQRGPLVYCFEQIDQSVPLELLRLSRTARIDEHYDHDLLGGALTLQGEGSVEIVDDWQGALYRSEPPKRKPVPFQAVPYFAWDNRQPGEMLVWLPETLGGIQ